MKEVYEEVGLTYETLKYYCNEELVPNHKRDKNNYRIFDEKDIAWIKGLMKLRACGMTIKDMKTYMHLCIEGISTIAERKEMLNHTKKNLELEMTRIEESIEYITEKNHYYDQIISGEIEYQSNLN